jgi:histidinol dehydrogenase
MPHNFDILDSNFEKEFNRFLSKKRESKKDINKSVQKILSAVSKNGDSAVINFTEKFDKVLLEPSGMRVSESEIAHAESACPDDVKKALIKAHSRITEFHKTQIPKDIDYTDDCGVRLGSRWRPIESVGLYVPGGTAAYPSSVLMNSIPAQVAGVERIVMVVPAPEGYLNPSVLTAAGLSGVNEIYRIGGAQAIASLAYGTETIASVNKIVGPGNAYVAAAKKQVFGVVGIDMIAGPSEITVVADSNNDPIWIAADLLSQAEHDESSQAILITDNKSFAHSVELAVLEHLNNLPRSIVARSSWERNGAIILVPEIESAIPTINLIAPEHLELACDQCEFIADRVINAGAIFLGAHTPEAIGDYIAGTNHVLPTGRTSRFSSGLGVLDFMKRTSLVSCSPSSLQMIGPEAVTLANAEGLEGHALSVSLRLSNLMPEK